MLHIYIYVRYGKRRKRKFGTGSWTRSSQGPSLNYPVVYLGWFTNPGCHREAELMSHCCIKVWLQSSVKWVHWCWPAGTALILQLPCQVSSLSLCRCHQSPLPRGTPAPSPASSALPGSRWLWPTAVLQSALSEGVSGQPPKTASHLRAPWGLGS